MFLRIWRIFFPKSRQSHLPSTATPTQLTRRYRNTQILEPILTPSATVVDCGEDGVESESPIELAWFTGTDELPLAFISEESLGVFTVGATGIEIEFLHDGSDFESEVAIFALDGLEHLDPASDEFVTTALSRANSNSHLGQIIISEPQGDRAAAADFELLSQPGMTRTVMLNPGEQFAVVMVPNGTIAEALETEAWTEAQRPVFSIAQANLQGAEHFVAQTDEGEPTIVGVEYSPQEQSEFTDLVLRIEGVQAQFPEIEPGSLDEPSWEFFHDLVHSPETDDLESGESAPELEAPESQLPLNPAPEPVLNPTEPPLEDALNDEGVQTIFWVANAEDSAVQPPESPERFVHPVLPAEPAPLEETEVGVASVVSVTLDAALPEDATAAPELLPPTGAQDGTGEVEVASGETQTAIAFTAGESEPVPHQLQEPDRLLFELLQRIDDVFEQVAQVKPDSPVSIGYVTPDEQWLVAKRWQLAKARVYQAAENILLAYAGGDLAQTDRMPTHPKLDQLGLSSAVKQALLTIFDAFVRNLYELFGLPEV